MSLDTPNNLYVCPKLGYIWDIWDWTLASTCWHCVLSILIGTTRRKLSSPELVTVSFFFSRHYNTTNPTLHIPLQAGDQLKTSDNYLCKLGDCRHGCWWRRRLLSTDRRSEQPRKLAHPNPAKLARNTKAFPLQPAAGSTSSCPRTGEEQLSPPWPWHSVAGKQEGGQAASRRK